MQILVLARYSAMQNKRRGAKEQSEDVFVVLEVWASMTDRVNKSFRYCY